jgi:hypothetical protein
MTCDFKGSDLSNQKGSASSCAQTCASSSGCTHFTWTSYNGGTCWMKSGSVSKSNAFYTGDQSMVCGIAPSNLKFIILLFFVKNNSNIILNYYHR